ncbi:BRCA1-A complex subunit RAP80 isoform X2 [Varanus komodoensis]|nr:BRCA1-A complex subunit RAP80 isoform X2 [Varanus komodoensis]XP_044306914.1 BRCA1-A complex subunit RAP80 isoform X2 [Varanus komodoensis]
MPKKKRKIADGSDAQPQDKEGEESKVSSNATLKHSFVDACIVISDSDGEQESKDEPVPQKKRTKQQLDRAKFAAKRKIAQMTEDEQFALALKMSEQEARQLNSQEEEEEELLRKAIAESLSSCLPSESSAAAAVPLASQAPASAAGQEDPELLTAVLSCAESPCSKCSSLSSCDKADENGQTDVAKRPLVVLTRLSQEIVESSLVSSIIVSPGKSQPFARSNENPSSPAGSSSSDTTSSLEEEMPVTVSPTFPQKPQKIWPLAPQRLFVGRGSPSRPAGKGADKCSLSDSKREPVVSTSEVQEKEPQKHNILDHFSHPASESVHQFEPSRKTCLSPKPAERIDMPEKAPLLCPLHVSDEECQQEERDVVHYYWGVPFCPKGVDPSKYTQVILCQLEVYQKSLKQAQRQLLQKRRFGEPVVPDSCSLRRGECGKGEEAIRAKEATDEQEGDDTDDKKEPERITWLLSPTSGEPNKNPEQNKAEGRSSESEDEPASTSCQASQVLFGEDVLEEREPMQITQSISALTPLDSKRSPDIATETHAEEEITVCPETQPSPSQAIEPESREIHSSSKDVSLQADADEDAGEDMSAHSPPADDPMSCPLCDRRFPVSEIELHAMYCNGIGEETMEDAPVMTRRQREAKMKATGCKETPESMDINKYEKCYLCKSLVPWKEYQRHVDGCLRSWAANGALGGRKLRHAKEEGRCEGRLLSMLEESEHKATDAEVAATPSRGEDSRQCLAEVEKKSEDDQDAWSPFPQPACSDSPIRSFTSISEAKDCLVDFKKQLPIGPGSRKQTKASLRNRKKF